MVERILMGEGHCPDFTEMPHNFGGSLYSKGLMTKREWIVSTIFAFDTAMKARGVVSTVLRSRRYNKRAYNGLHQLHDLQYPRRIYPERFQIRRV